MPVIQKKKYKSIQEVPEPAKEPPKADIKESIQETADPRPAAVTNPVETAATEPVLPRIMLDYGHVKVNDGAVKVLGKAFNTKFYDGDESLVLSPVLLKKMAYDPTSVAGDFDEQKAAANPIKKPAKVPKISPARRRALQNDLADFQK